MRIADAFGGDRPVFSFEFFPPKTPKAEEELFQTVSELATLRPTFVSVTYGAGGSTRQLTIDVVTRIKNEIGIEAMAHLTCVGHSAAEIAEICDRLADCSIENVLPLRGDPPRGQTEFVRPADGFGHGSELTRFIRSRWEFCLGGAGYPEKHVEAPSLDDDLAHLKEKVDAGAEFILTNLFFDPVDYFRYVERARAIGVKVPIVPGILPVTDPKQLSPTGFVTRCGASIPEALRDLVDRAGSDSEAVIAAGVEWAAHQSRELLAGGAPGIHFYTLNRSQSSRMVFQQLLAAGAIPALA